FLTPFLSVYVDHRDSKKIVLWVNGLLALFISLLGALVVLDVDSLALFYTIQFCVAVCYSINKPASQAFIKEAFEQSDLAFIISKGAALTEIAGLIGMSAIGFLLVKVSIALCFFLNACTFAACVLLFLNVKRVNKKSLNKNKQLQYIKEIALGWQFVKRTVGMRYLLYLSILNSISIQMATVLFLPLALALGGGSGLYSVFEMSFSIGCIAAGFGIQWAQSKLRHNTIVFTMGGMLVGTLLLFSVRAAELSWFPIFILGFFTMAHLITIQTLIQLRTDIAFMGRVIGLRTILASGVKVTSGLVTGVLIESLGLYAMMVVFAVVLVVSFTTVRAMRQVSRFEEEAVEI
ncbi:MAG: MFS transporter, partial [Bacilli bacterium]